jgi:chromosome segregation ATPase
METCEKHDYCVVVYSNHTCPLCASEKEANKYLDDITELEQDKVSLLDENNRYEADIKDLESEVKSLKTDFESITKAYEELLERGD